MSMGEQMYFCSEMSVLHRSKKGRHPLVERWGWKDGEASEGVPIVSPTSALPPIQALSSAHLWGSFLSPKVQFFFVKILYLPSSLMSALLWRISFSLQRINCLMDRLARWSRACTESLFGDLSGFCPQNDFLVCKSEWVFPLKISWKLKLIWESAICLQCHFSRDQCQESRIHLNCSNVHYATSQRRFISGNGCQDFPQTSLTFHAQQVDMSGHRDRVTWACRLFRFQAPRPKIKSLWLGFQCRLLIHGTAACYSKLRCINIAKLLKFKSLLI